MPAPKTLLEHCQDKTWRARLDRHRDLLHGPVVPIPRLAVIQARFVGCQNEYEARAIAVEFQQAIDSPAPDDEALAAAEAAEFDELTGGRGEIVDDDSIGRTIDRAHRTLLARDLRNGTIRGRRLTFREIGNELGVSASAARRLVVGSVRGTPTLSAKPGYSRR